MEDTEDIKLSDLSELSKAKALISNLESRVDYLEGILDFMVAQPSEVVHYLAAEELGLLVQRTTVSLSITFPVAKIAGTTDYVAEVMDLVISGIGDVLPSSSRVEFIDTNTKILNRYGEWE